MKALAGILTSIITTLVIMWMQSTKDKKEKKNERPQIHGSTVVRAVTKETPVSVRAQEAERGQQIFGEREEYGKTLPAGKKRVLCPYCNTMNIVPEGTTVPYSCHFCCKIL